MKNNLKKFFLEEIYKKISLEELKKLENFLELEIKKISEKNNNLEKKDLKIIVADLDDTIFSTKKIRTDDFMGWKRWDEGNDFLKNIYGLEKLINKYYKNKTFLETISSKLKENKDLILTAWLEELQIMKIKELWLEKINYIITEKAQDKILELIKYFYFDLKFLPKKITIYEDRPHFFIYFKDFLEKILKTKIEIIYVEMDWNEKEPKLFNL